MYQIFYLHREFPVKISFICLHHFALRAKAVKKIQECVQLSTVVM